jgi:hypothetical protein
VLDEWIFGGRFDESSQISYRTEIVSYEDGSRDPSTSLRSGRDDIFLCQTKRVHTDSRILRENYTPEPSSLYLSCRATSRHPFQRLNASSLCISESPGISNESTNRFIRFSLVDMAYRSIIVRQATSTVGAPGKK